VRLYQEGKELGQQVAPVVNGMGRFEAYDLGVAEMSTSEALMDDSEIEDALASHAYMRPHRGENDRLVPKRFVSPVLCCAAVGIVLFVYYGCAMPAFSADLMGIVGLVVESGKLFREEAITEYSLFTTVEVLYQQADFRGTAGDYVGLGSLGAVLVITVLLVPCLQAALLLYHWFRPMSRKLRNRVIAGNEILQAWQYTEVFALSVVAGSW